MIRSRIFFVFIFILSLSGNIYAQFVNLQLKIEAELSATVEQDLDFGTQITNAGRTEIQLGDVKTGVFSIRAFHTQNVYLNLQYPDVLVNAEAGVNAEIPIQLNINYNNSGINSVANSSPLPANHGFVSVHEKTALNSNDIWKELFLYVYGAIEIGNIPNGVYTGEIILSVDYD
ncbi:MAG: hypothetical protein WD059_01760 [Balneolaceae bacterium]